MNPLYFLRMSKWARNPPSKQKVILVFGIIAVCLVLYSIERWIGWPEWLTPANPPRGRILR